MIRCKYILNGSRGQYIPRDFCREMILESFGLEQGDPDVIECLKGPPNGLDSEGEGSEHYWKAWDNIVGKAVRTDKEGHTWTLCESDGLYLVRDDMPKKWFDSSILLQDGVDYN